MISGYGGGHNFVNGVCECGRKLVDLRGVKNPDDVGKPNIAHRGTATGGEIDSINELLAKMDKVFANVMGF